MIQLPVQVSAGRESFPTDQFMTSYLSFQKDILVIEKDKATIQNVVYTTLVQVLGGIILSITAYVGYCNFRVGSNADLSGAYLSGSDLSNANLAGANLINADLSFDDHEDNDDGYYANCEDDSDYTSHWDYPAKLFGANLLNAKLDGAKLNQTNLSETKNLVQQQLDFAIVDKHTELPDYLKPTFKIDRV